MNQKQNKKIKNTTICRVVVVIYHSTDQQQQIRSEIMKDMHDFIVEQSEAEVTRKAEAERVNIKE